MAEALISAVLEELASVMYQEIHQEVRQVVGVQKEVEKLTSTPQTTKAVIADAEKRQVTEEVLKVWLEKLKDISYDMDDVLDEWNTTILKLQIEGVESAPIIPKKVCSYIPSPCFCFNQVVKRHVIACKIKELRERLEMIASEKDKFGLITNIEEPERQRTTSFVDVSEVYGRDHDKKTIVSKLLCESSQEERDLHVISTVGMGGIGKTTLAQLAYEDHDVKAQFEKRIWVCVSDPFNEIRIAKQIAKALDGYDPSSLDWEDLPEHIHKAIAGKKFLLVLDDVWTDDFKKWEPLKHCLNSGARGSRILVTTRNERVAKMMGTTHMHLLEALSEEECWSLFSRIAFFGRNREEDPRELEEIGRRIADKCKGLPLAAKTLGSLMQFKKTKLDWHNVLDSEIWELEEVEKGLFPPLLLSYYDLPPALKQCFSYCAIFPKDYVMERDKLIKLWMAQGYLSLKRSMEAEVTGREYFENLIMRSFFQDFGQDEEDGSINYCKMHDIVHDFAQFLTKNECFIMEVEGGKEPSTNSSYKKVRHLSVILAVEASFLISIYDAKNLRTFSVLRKVTTGIATTQLADLFHRLKCLRALDLSDNSIVELPREVGNLMHLRYLNLSRNMFKELPETVCDLCNLQTLDLGFCGSLEELPKGMGKLINLRHLIFFGNLIIGFLPSGIGRLSSLQTITKFIVGGGGDKRESCKIGDLKNLNKLQGRLPIEGLGNVADASEASKAELKNKKHLIGLVLEFSTEGLEGNMDDVIESLQPHPNLDFLEIWEYRGTLFPSWMMLLTKLKTLQLHDCRNCELLPPVGKLPSLESLGVFSMNSLRKVGVEFLGLGINDNDDNHGTAREEDTVEACVTIAFPKLKELKFHFMQAWEEWDVMITRRKKRDEISIMPCLRSLVIVGCPKLKALPHHLQTMPLEQLLIQRCPILKQRCKERVGEDWIKISHIPKIQIED